MRSHRVQFLDYDLGNSSSFINVSKYKTTYLPVLYLHICAHEYNNCIINTLVKNAEHTHRTMLINICTIHNITSNYYPMDIPYTNVGSSYTRIEALTGCLRKQIKIW